MINWNYVPWIYGKRVIDSDWFINLIDKETFAALQHLDSQTV